MPNTVHGFEPRLMAYAKQAVAKRKVGLFRWCHAHPTWTYWALLFLGNLLLKRYLVTWLQHQLRFDLGRCSILNPFGSSTECTLCITGSCFKLWLYVQILFQPFLARPPLAVSWFHQKIESNRGGTGARLRRVCEDLGVVRHSARPHRWEPLSTCEILRV